MDDLVLNKFYLSQNYPDPFKEQTTIEYCVPVKTGIKLEIFDYKGRRIRTLVDEIKEPGTYRAELKGHGLKEGIYYYRLSADRFEETKRLLYLK